MCLLLGVVELLPWVILRDDSESMKEIEETGIASY